MEIRITNYLIAIAIFAGMGILLFKLEKKLSNKTEKYIDKVMCKIKSIRKN